MAKPREGAKKKKKRWYAITAPKEFKAPVIGESLAAEPSDLQGRKLKFNLMNLTRDPKKQNITVTLQVTSVSGERCSTELVKYEMNKGHVKKISKKATTKIDDSFVINTKDNKKMRIKPLLMTRYKTHNSIATGIRKSMHTYFTDYSKNHTAQDIFGAIIMNKVQKDVKHHLKPIYPISSSEIRVLNIL